MKTGIAILVTLAVAGCATTPDPVLERRNALYGPYCERMGRPSGTFGFADCVMWHEMVDIEQQKARAQKEAGQAR
jgi:hypothetical protein